MSVKMAATSFSLSSLYFADESSEEEGRGPHVATRTTRACKESERCTEFFRTHAKCREQKCLL